MNDLFSHLPPPPTAPTPPLRPHQVGPRPRPAPPAKAFAQPIPPTPAFSPTPAVVVPTVPHNGTATSSQAATAARVREQKAGKEGKISDRIRVLECLQEAGKVGKTRFEIAADLEIPVQTVCARVSQLLGQGLAMIKSEQMEGGGTKVSTRLSPSGEPASVLVATEHWEGIGGANGGDGANGGGR